jgi:hypothetical protein
MWRRKTALAVLAIGLCVNAVYAGPFTPGNIVISRIGDAEHPSSGDATPVHLLEVSVDDPDGTFVQDILIPTEASGRNHRFALTGYFRDGHLKRSANGLFLTIGGYDAGLDENDPTHFEPNEADAMLVPRVIARIDPFGIIDTTTALTDAYTLLHSTGGMHCVITDAGRNFWMAGRGNPGLTARVRYAAYGATESVVLNSSNDPRSVEIFEGQLYAVYNQSNTRGVMSVGVGLPMTSGQVTLPLPEVTLPDGIESGSPYDHFWWDADTVYLTDDRTVHGSGGLHKYVRDTNPVRHCSCLWPRRA